MLKRSKQTTILLTGASGFIGKYLLDILKDDYSVIAMARRSGTEAGVPFHHNIRWVQWNIANKLNYSEVMGYLIGRVGVDIVIHLAGYYDYEYDDNPEYERTNINGTRNVLQLATNIDVKHFIFAGSLAACKFPHNGQYITENTLPNAEFSYARSKKIGEEMCREYASYFTCSIVRFAAVFSDWCEYGPLYQFLSAWLSGKWDSRILGGKGESAITYIHIHDLTNLILKLIKKTNKLPRYGTYVASPDGSISHKELFKTATRDYYGKPSKPLFIPRMLAYPGLIAKAIMGKINLVSKPFEKFWMLKYIDLKLNVDASRTQQLLSWTITPRYHILRRLIYLLDKMKSHPNEWLIKNEAATKRQTHRPNLLIYEQLIKDEMRLLDKIESILFSEENNHKFPNYKQLNRRELRITLSTLYHLLLASVRSADRSLMQKYMEEIALKRYTSGFTAKEMTDAVSGISETIINELESIPELANEKQEIYDYIGLTFQLAMDVVEDVFENIDKRLPKEKLALLSKQRDAEREKEIKSLSAFYQEYPDG
jgi:nucleoside-diphosphate-sugar epimerase